LDHQGEPRELPNHGVSQGYRIHRAYANRWQLVKTKGEWMIRTRTILTLFRPPELSDIRTLFVILSDKASALHFVLLHRKCSAEGMLAPQRRQIGHFAPVPDFSRRGGRANGLRGQRRWFVKNLDSLRRLNT